MLPIVCIEGKGVLPGVSKSKNSSGFSAEEDCPLHHIKIAAPRPDNSCAPRVFRGAIMVPYAQPCTEDFGLSTSKERKALAAENKVTSNNGRNVVCTKIRI